MGFLLLSFFAGILTVLAPCILPLLPVVIGSSVARSRLTPYIVIGSLAVSIFVFTFLLKVSTVFIAIPPSVWTYLSGGILLVAGLLLLFPTTWNRLAFITRANQTAHQTLGGGFRQQSYRGDIIIGASLGPIFSTCSPTYFVILGTILPTSLWQGTVYLLAYISGLVLVLLLIAQFGQQLITRVNLAASGVVKRAVGGLLIIVGLFVMSGYDKSLQTWVLDTGFFDISRFEQRLLDQTQPPATPLRTDRSSISPVNVPPYLAQQFPDTDFARVDQALEGALSGRPGKDGIPALTYPAMEPINSFRYPDSVQAIVLIGDTETKVYPYNILTWHEIINDTIDEVPVAVTFCPLCGSAIVFARTLDSSTVVEFGVSGSLLESNMIMYDRTTESLWQQSTGATLAGTYHPARLEILPFQLMTIGDIKQQYPTAEIVSERTGHQRDYGRNPYAGYETDSRFVFAPSSIDDRFFPKDIMVVFRVNDIPTAVPWVALRARGEFSTVVDNIPLTLTVTPAGELTIVGNEITYPFYFEMWFSYAVQHGRAARVVTIP